MVETETEVAHLNPKADLEEVGPCKYKIKVEVSLEKVKEKLDEKYKGLSDNLAMPGFRRGRAPRKLLERKFGKDVLNELKQELLTASFDEVIEEKKLEPIGDPQLDFDKIDLKDDAPFNYELVIETRPKFELSEYKGIKVKKPAVKVTAKEIDNALNNLREMKAEYVSAEDGKAKQDDQIVADFELTCEGKQVLKSENASLLLNDKIAFYGVMLPEFYKQILNKKVGNNVEYDITLPDNFKEKILVGKNAKISITIKSIKRKKLPELNDAWAKTMDIETVEQLKEELKKHITKDKDASARSAMADEIVAGLIDKIDFAMPEGLIQKSADEHLGRLKLDLAMKGLDEDAIKKELDKHKGESRDKMVKGLKAHFILDAIAQKERIFVTDDEVEQQITVMASQMGRWPHEVKQYLAEQGMMPQLRRQMREDKTREFLLTSAAVEES
ncbi:MAG: trigger factor [Planctomycetes bacterium RBG_16_43_13]|nr:MAG: trigger factor [Planctomycetes bacterium RBG_16_43_13]